MKANFALSLSFDGIRMLHRAAGGWRLVGEVKLDQPDLAEALKTLRKTALGLEPSGLRTKLIVPNEQVKYLTIDAPEDDYKKRLDRATQALDGVTPYPVAQLAYDISPDGARTHVAAIARETLSEAEAFAVEHRFAPISVVATPEDASGFLGEPFFGPTEHAKTLVSPNDGIEPDQVAVVVVGDISEPAGPVVTVEEGVAAVTSSGPILNADTENNDTQLDPESLAPDKQLPDVEQDIAGAAETAKVPPVPKAPPMGAAAPAAAELSTDKPPSDGQSGPVIGFSSRRARPPEETLSPAAKQRSGDGEGPLNLVGATHTPAAEAAEPIAGGTAMDEVAELPPAQDQSGFGSALPSAAAARLGALKDQAKSAGAATRNLPGSLQKNMQRLSAQRPEAQEIAAARLTSQNEEKQRLTVFGARQPAAPAAERARPRFLGLILTAMLLLFLAGLAVWLPAMRGDGSAGLFSANPPAEPIAALDTPAPDPGTTAQSPNSDALPKPQVVEPGVEENVEVAALDIDSLPAPTPALPAPTLRPDPETFDPAVAQEHYAVTGIWTIPPKTPEVPGLLSLENLYLTSIDRTDLDFDAVALIQTQPRGVDVALVSPANPPPPGTEYDLDARGFVQATPEGAMTPEGVRVFAGRPVITPARFPSRAATAPVVADTDRAILAVFRPRMRPLDLQEKTERSNLGGLSRAELGDVRPKLRPVSLQEQEAAPDETPTDEAVAASLRPNSRPRGFAKIIERATRAPAPAPQGRDQTTTQTAAVAPRTVSPSIPSSASVAKQATVRNAINLNKINLMGVYGTPSSRRALVRMSNGRYKKVKVGDRIDGGRVSAIGESELRYQKGSRNIVLKMPKT